MAHGFIMDQIFVETVMNLTIQEAAAVGLYDHLPGHVWHIPGPKGMRCAVGWLPYADRGLTKWSFAEWWKQGMLIGIKIAPLQEPLYYQIKMKLLRTYYYGNSRHLCSRHGCGKYAEYFGVHLRFRERRLDLCRDCLRNLKKRRLVQLHHDRAVMPAA